MARPERFELPTLWFEARCSIQLSYERVRRRHGTSAVDGKEGDAPVALSSRGYRGARRRGRREQNASATAKAAHVAPPLAVVDEQPS